MNISTNLRIKSKSVLKEGIYRHELKYETDPDKANIIRHTLSPMLTADSNTGVDGSYIVRSLYFETPYADDYVDKELGVQFRQKMRLRNYGGSDIYRLEIKSKSGDVATKYSVNLTKEQALQVAGGVYSCLLDIPGATRGYIYHQMMTKVYRPFVTVSDKRYPFTNPAGNFRLTFDTDIRYSVSPQSLFEDVQSTGIVTDKTIIEVKYDDFVPDWITDCLLKTGVSAGESSKYAAACRNIFD